MTITGTNFSATAANNVVKFNGTAAAVTAASATSLTATVPSGATSGKISVTVSSSQSGINSQTATSAADYTVGYPPVTISGFSPTSGPFGTTVVVSGSNFGASQGIGNLQLNGVMISPTSWSDTSITFTVPDGATDGPITVVAATRQSATTATPFTITNPPPVITGFTPVSGQVGDTVTITGTGFSSANLSNIVKFNGIAAMVVGASATSLTVTVPTAATSGKLSVTVNGKTGTSASDFTVVPTPIITSITPSSGPMNSVVTIDGYNFDPVLANNAVSINGVQQSLFYASPTKLRFQIVHGTTTGPIVIYRAGPPVISVVGPTFTLTNPPTIAQISPVSSPAITPVVIYGANFDDSSTDANTVTFNGIAAPVTQASATQLSVWVPSQATTGQVVITNKNGTSTSVPASNVASARMGASASASTTFGAAFGTSGAIDGDIAGTLWSNGGGWSDGTFQSFPDWLQVNFSTAQRINDVIVYTLGDNYSSGVDPTDSTAFTQYGLTAFDVQVLQDSTWTTVASITGNNLVKRRVVFMPVTTTAVRVVGNASADGNYSRIVEVEAHYDPSNFIVGPVPTASITDFTPKQGGPGTQVTITGQYFGSDPLGIGNVRFFNGQAGGQPAQILSWSDTSIVAVVPLGSRDGPISVGTPSRDLATSAASFDYVPPPVTIDSLSPSQGQVVFTNVTISGSGFSAVASENKVTFTGGVDGEIIQADYASLVVRVPEGAQTGPIIVAVTIDGATQTATSPAFTVLPTVSLDAQLVSQSPFGQPGGGSPPTWDPGLRVALSVTMTNTGLTSWSQAQNIRLGELDGAGWVPGGRVNLPNSNPVSIGDSVTFTAVIVLPSTPGTYVASWQMVQDSPDGSSATRFGPVVSGWIYVGSQAPQRPTCVTQLLPSEAPSSGDAKLRWDAPARGTAPDNYRIAISEDGAGWRVIDGVPATSLSWSSTSTGQPHYYAVAACEKTPGICSDYVQAQTQVPGCTPPAVPPNAPALLTVLPPDSGSSVIGLTWVPSSTGPQPSYYVLQVSTSPTGPWTVANSYISATETSTTYTAQASGTYYFGIAACNDVGCSDYTPSAAVTVTVAAPTSPATPTPPTLATAPSADTVSDSVGSTTGQFAVDASGNASYHIPIYTPRGVGGLTPGLAISYNSGGGEGALGVGWQLEGESSISICRKTQEHGDGLGVSELAYTQPAKAAYCLDGQRLILMSGNNGQAGALYRTENDLFARVKIELADTINGSSASNYSVPTTWLVQNKDGSSHRYGGTDTDSASGLHLAQLAWKRSVDNAIFTKSWYRYEIKDTNGNAIRYNYANMATAQAAWVALSSVTYSGGTITFSNRLPASSGNCSFGQPISYQGGIPVQRRTMLGANAIQSGSAPAYCDAASAAGDITVSSGGTVLRNYKLTYQHAVNNPMQLQLTGVQECDNSSTQVCYAPTKFDWADASAWSASAINPGTPPVINGTSQRKFFYQNPSGMRFGDVNGDGRADAVFLIDYGTHRHMGFRIGFSDPSKGSYDGIGGGFSSFFDEDTSFGNIPNSNCASDSDSGTPRNNYTCPQFYKFLDPAGSFQLLDFNGDGKDDLILLEATNGDYTDDPRPDQFRWVVWLSDGTKFASKISGINAVPFTNFNNGAYHSVDNGASCPTAPCDMPLAKALNYDEHSHSGRMHVADVDGDGLPDAFVLNDQSASVWLLKPNTTGQQCQAKMRDTNGTVNTIQVACPYLFQGPYNVVIDVPQGAAPCPIGDFTAQELRVADFNGDGRADILLKQNSACAAPNNPSASNEYLQIFTAIGIGTDGAYHFAPGYAWPTSFTDPTGYNHRELFQIVDINGDGLPDVAFSRGGSNDAAVDDSGGWVYQLNTGDGSFTSPACTVIDSTAVGGCKFLSGPYEVQFGDYDGDGKADLIVPQYRCNGGAPFCANLLVYLWQDSANGGQGGFSQQPVITPFLSPDIGSDTKRLFSYLADVDGDGYPDQLSTNPTGDDANGLSSYSYLNTGLNHGGWLITRSASHHKPRNLITSIQSGLGATTQLTYGLLTYSSLYYREYSSYTLASGYGAPVQDTFAPRWVVQYAESTAPTELDSTKPQTTGPGAMSTIRYRYAGQKIQGGGRGSLGFHKVYSTDEQTGVTTVTTYNQAYPFTGTPIETMAYQDSPSVDTDCDVSAGGNPDAQACMKYGIQPDGLSGKPILSDSRDTFAAYWQNGSDIALATASTGTTTGLPLTTQTPPKPLFVARTGSAQLKYGLDSTLLSAQQSTFTYTGNNGIAYGELQSSTVTDYASATSAFVFSSPVRTTTTAQQYGQDDENKWFLGRLTQSTTTVTGSNTDGVSNDTISRTSTFEYDATTGQLIGEHLQQGAGKYQEVDKYHFYDGYGNEIEVDTCSSVVTCSALSTAKLSASLASFVFKSATNDAWVQRYARSDFSATSATGGVDGVYANATYAPFSDGGNGASEVKTLQVNSRDAFGTPKDTTDAHGVEVKTTTNTLGRTYFSASNTGAATQTIYRWCDTGLNPYVAANVSLANQVPCPSNAVYRVQTYTSIGTSDGSSRSPATWTYYDSLGRVVLKLQQGFDASQTVAVATAYDNLGRTTKTTEPYFTYDATSSQVGQNADTTLTSSGDCLGAPFCTRQFYDILGRVLQINHPNGSATRTTYTGLNAKVTSPANGSSQIETRQKTQNHLGQVVTVTDANGSTVSNAYDPSGNVLSVTRSGGGSSAMSTMTYDVLGRKTGLIDPDAGSWTYSYNALGEQIAKTGSSVCTTTRYDGQGRAFVRNDYPNATCSGTAETTASWTYDSSAAKAGLLQTATGIDNGLTEIQTPSYDGFGRVSSVATTLGAMHYMQKTTYDEYGRGFQGFFSGDGIAETGELAVYNALGYPYQTRDGENGTQGTIYQEVSSMDARGHVTAELRADGHLSTNRSYDNAMGWLTKIASSQTLAASSSPAAIQNLVYQYDALGNVVLRKDQSPNTSTNEYACYDKLQRLTWQGNTALATPTSGCPVSPTSPTPLPASVGTAPITMSADARQALYPAPLMPASATALANGVGTQNSYDAFGNITSNGQFGYVYQNYTNSAVCTSLGGVSTAGVDAVTQANGLTYCYDARGNQIASIDSAGNAQRTATYTSYDALRTASSNTSAHTTRWTYGIGRERAVREDATDAVPTAAASSVTHFLGNAEISLNPTTKNAAIQVKRYLGGLILTQTIGSSTSANYLFTDNLGSTHRITDANGIALSGAGSSQAYTAFGSRATASNGIYAALDFNGSADFDTSATHHGYTGHEMLDEVGLIHMNGRVYDAALQRFVQADPFVQDAGNLQSLNRYSYVLNNPLATTDPTGYWGHRQQGYLRTAGAIAITIASYGWASSVVGVTEGQTFAAAFTAAGSGTQVAAVSIIVAGGATAGYVQTGNARGAVLGGLEAGLDFGIGQAIPYASNMAGNVAAHAALGGVMAVLQGGKFGHGFISAGLSAEINPNLPPADIVPGTIRAAVIGGTISEVTGGKFANGALSAAFEFAFNQMMSGPSKNNLSYSQDGPPPDAGVTTFALDAQLSTDGSGGFEDVPTAAEICAAALTIANKGLDAVARAKNKWDVLLNAASGTYVPASILGAIGVRESGFQTINEVGGGHGMGVFQMTDQPGVGAAQANDLAFAARYAAHDLLGPNLEFLSKKFPEFTYGNLMQATAASYNMSPYKKGNFSGNPEKIDSGTTGNNYGSNIIGLMACFR
ncbi:IPT/TIG domain-containing protein [Rudaea cellulosilytica]|uniref:IPT/TIG domain-containing protein n=1 Tax=Rudaea cellulosilytica TaxID=540746 RepID=UPI001FDF5F34|nr:IPT/TIG domain-containing protein [Rudaea cellulosilytica]